MKVWAGGVQWTLLREGTTTGEKFAVRFLRSWSEAHPTQDTLEIRFSVSPELGRALTFQDALALYRPLLELYLPNARAGGGQFALGLTGLGPPQ